MGAEARPNVSFRILRCRSSMLSKGTFGPSAFFVRRFDNRRYDGNAGAVTDSIPQNGSCPSSSVNTLSLAHAVSPDGTSNSGRIILAMEFIENNTGYRFSPGFGGCKQI